MELPFAGAAPAVRADARPARRAAGAAARRAARRAGPALRRRRPTASWSRWPCSACCPRSAEERPLLCLVDDAQWLDGASGQVLGFVARRLLAESVAIVFAVREPAEHGTSSTACPSCRSAGLTRRTRARCWRRAIPGRLDEPRPRPDRRRDARQPARAAGAAARHERGGAGRRLRAPARGAICPAASRSSYLRRVARAARRRRGGCCCWRRPTRSATPTLLWRAADGSGSSTSALAPAEEAALLEIGARVRFRHPLVRSAVYRRGAAARTPAACTRRWRRSAIPTLDADRRAWHRALAARGPGRGGGRRARALGGSRADARRPRGRRGVPRAGGRR